MHFHPYRFANTFRYDVPLPAADVKLEDDPEGRPLCNEILAANVEDALKAVQVALSRLVSGGGDNASALQKSIETLQKKAALTGHIIVRLRCIPHGYNLLTEAVMAQFGLANKVVTAVGGLVGGVPSARRTMVRNELKAVESGLVSDLDSVVTRWTESLKANNASACHWLQIRNVAKKVDATRSPRLANLNTAKVLELTASPVARVEVVLIKGLLEGVVGITRAGNAIASFTTTHIKKSEALRRMLVAGAMPRVDLHFGPFRSEEERLAQEREDTEEPRATTFINTRTLLEKILPAQLRSPLEGTAVWDTIINKTTAACTAGVAQYDGHLEHSLNIQRARLGMMYSEGRKLVQKGVWFSYNPLEVLGIPLTADLDAAWAEYEARVRAGEWKGTNMEFLEANLDDDLLGSFAKHGVRVVPMCPSAAYVVCMPANAVPRSRAELIATNAPPHHHPRAV